MSFRHFTLSAAAAARGKRVIWGVSGYGRTHRASDAGEYGTDDHDNSKLAERIYMALTIEEGEGVHEPELVEIIKVGDDESVRLHKAHYVKNKMAKGVHSTRVEADTSRRRGVISPSASRKRSFVIKTGDNSKRMLDPVHVHGVSTSSRRLGIHGDADGYGITEEDAANFAHVEENSIVLWVGEKFGELLDPEITDKIRVTVWRIDSEYRLHGILLSPPASDTLLEGYVMEGRISTDDVKARRIRIRGRSREKMIEQLLDEQLTGTDVTPRLHTLLHKLFTGQ